MKKFMNFRSTTVLSIPTSEMASPPDGLKQTVHTTPLIADTLRVLSVLNDGWVLLEALHLLASGKNNEGDGYLLSFMHPQRMQICKLQVRTSAQIMALLDTERVPMV